MSKGIDMLRLRRTTAVVMLLLACGCNGSQPVPKMTSTNKAASDKAGSKAAEPELVSVPEQAEPGDADFPRGSEAFAALVKAAESSDGEGWAKAEARIQELGAAATAALVERLEDQNQVARELAAMFLAQIGPEAAPAAKGLIKLLKDDSAFARVNAAAALSTMEGFEEQAVPVLTELLADADENIRLTAATSLRNVGPAAEVAIGGLTRALKDPNPQIRTAAATTLGEIGPSAKQSLPALRKMGTDAEEAVVSAAARAIRRIDADSIDKTTLATPASATE